MDGAAFSPRPSTWMKWPLSGAAAHLALWSIGFAWIEGAHWQAFASTNDMFAYVGAIVAAWLATTRMTRRDEVLLSSAMAAAAVLLFARLSHQLPGASLLDAVWSALQGGVLLCAFIAPAVSAHVVARSRGALDRSHLALAGTGFWLATVAGGILARFITPYGPRSLPGPAWNEMNKIVSWLLLAAIVAGGAMAVIGLRRYARLASWIRDVRAGRIAGWSIGEREALGLMETTFPRLFHQDGDDGVLQRAAHAGQGPFRGADVPVPVALVPFGWFDEAMRKSSQACNVVLLGGLGFLVLFWTWNLAIGLDVIAPTRLGVMWLVPALYAIAFRE